MRTQQLLFVAMLGAACSSAPPPTTTLPKLPVEVTPPVAPITPDQPAPLPPRDASCDQQPGENDVAGWHAWQLRCEFVMPMNPIAGEHVEAIVPHPPGGHGPCIAGEITHEMIPAGDHTQIRVHNATTGFCDNVGMTIVTLGLLAPGEYRLDTGYYQTTFVVRPVGSDPGDLDEDYRLRVEVAKTHSPGTCFGMPPGEMPHRDPAFAQTRIANQMRKAFPRLSIEELEGLADRANRISITPTPSPDTWAYGYTDGGCCIISEVTGTITHSSNGSFSVSPGTVVSSHDEPC